MSRRKIRSELTRQDKEDLKWGLRAFWRELHIKKTGWVRKPWVDRKEEKRKLLRMAFGLKD